MTVNDFPWFFWFLAVCLLPSVDATSGTSGAWAAAPDRALAGVRADGSAVAGALRDLVPGKQITFEHDGRRVEVSWNDLVWWGRFRDRYQGTQLVLANGSRLVADILRIESGQVVIGGRLWSETSIPLAAVRAIVFQCSASNLRRDLLFDQVAELATDQDHLILENGDQLVGQLVQPVRPAAGEFNPTMVQWKTQAAQTPLRIPLQRTTAIVPRRTPVATNAATRDLVKLGFRDGSYLNASRIVVKNGRLEIQLGGTISLTTESTGLTGEDPWGDIVFIQPLSTPIVYLSDIQPLGYKCVPYLDVTWPYRADRNVAGGLLRHRGDIYFKGIGVHSSARLAYDLDKPYHWLQAELTLDQCAGNAGSVVFRVYLQDAGAQWRLAFSSPVVRGNQPIVPMRVDVRSAKRVALIVDFADHADVRDRADWLNIRLVP